MFDTCTPRGALTYQWNVIVTYNHQTMKKQRKQATDFNNIGLAVVMKTKEGQDGPVSLIWLPDKFRINWPFGSREEVQYRFSRWRPSWISNQNDFSYFRSTSHLDTSNEVSSQLSFWFRIKSSKKIFNMAARATPPWISDQNDFSFFWSTNHPGTPYQVNWPFCSEEVQNRFSRWRP